MTPFEKGICTNHTGKMRGIWSFSTNCRTNPVCKARAAVPGSICSRCYAQRQLSYQHSTANKCQRNTELVCDRLLNDDELPRLYGCKFFRWESFGDLQSWEQAANYLRASELNPEVQFSLFTKNPWFVQKALDNGAVKPGNLTVVLSSPDIGLPLPPRYVRDLYPFIDIVFTVYPKTYTGPIQCGGRSCALCGRCYTTHKGPDELPLEISERLK